MADKPVDVDAIEAQLHGHYSTASRRMVAEDFAPKLVAEVRRLQKLIVRADFSPPCKACGYNGPGFYQPDQHSCAKWFHERQQEPDDA